MATFATVNARNRQDAVLQTSIAVPAASASASATAFKMVGTRKPETMELGVDVPAMPNNVDSSKSVTITIEHSAALGSGFVALPGAEVIVVPGVATSGSVALQRRIRIPVGALDFYRVKVDAESGCGSNVAQTITLAALF